MMHLFLVVAVTLTVILYFLSLWILFQKPRKTLPRLVLYITTAGLTPYLLEPNSMKRISSLVAFFFLNLVALSVTGVKTAIDGAFSMVSSDPGILLVEQQADGRFLIKVISIGLATLTVTGDADLGDGVKPITNIFKFDVYDGSIEADHFDVALTDLTLKPVSTETAATIETTTESSAA